MGLIGDNGNEGDISGFVLRALVINMTHVPIMNLHRQWPSPRGRQSHNYRQWDHIDQSAVKICKL